MSRRNLNPELRCLEMCCAQAVGLRHAVKTPPNGIDWAEFLELALEHDLAPLLGSRLLTHETSSLPWASSIPSHIIDALREEYRYAGIEAAAFHVELGRVMAALREQCDPIHLKGTALRLTTYETAAERLMCDVDLLVSGDEVEGAGKILVSRGYRPVGAPLDGHHHGAPLASSVTGLAFELHTNLSTPPFSDTFMALVRRHTARTNNGELVLDRPMALLHHAHHAVSDLVDSPLLRNLLEVGWMADSLNPGEVETFLGLVSIGDVELPVSRALGLAHDLFGTPVHVPRGPRSAFEDLAFRRMEWTGSRTLASPMERFERNVADDLTTGESARSPRSLKTARLRLASGSLRTKITGGLRRLRNRLEPAATNTAPIGEGLMIHALDSGEVHWLDSMTSAAWQESRNGGRADTIVRALRERGLSRRNSRLAIGRLVQCGLLRRV